MNSISSFFLFSTILGLAQSQATSQSCMACARGINYFCISPAQFSNPWEIQCCYPGSSNENCQPTANRKCSQQFSESISRFYMLCPGQSKENCGLKSNYDGLNIYASGSKKTFSFSGLRYQTEPADAASYAVCSYQVMNPPGGYSSGKIFVKFTRVDFGVKVYISSDGAADEAEISNENFRN